MIDSIDWLPLDGRQEDGIGVVGAKDEHVHRFVDRDVLRRHHHGGRNCGNIETFHSLKKSVTTAGRTVNLEELRSFDGLVLTVLGDCVGRLTGDVTLVIVTVQREDQSAPGDERSVLLRHTKTQLGYTAQYTPKPFDRPSQISNKKIKANKIACSAADLAGATRKSFNGKRRQVRNSAERNPMVRLFHADLDQKLKQLAKVSRQS